MHYDNIVSGHFVARPNRFIAEVEIDGELTRAHVKNTGRCKELLVPGARVFLEDFDGRMGTRKMRYSLIGVEKEVASGSTEVAKLMINMDSQAPNHVVREALEAGTLSLPGFGRASKVKWEHKYGDSRVDFYLENDNGDKGLVEVKGVTLEEDGVARFPDAPTQRGIKHIHELQHAVHEGYYAAILFVIQMKPMKWFEPNDVTHEAFGTALRQADKSGVHVLAYDCNVTTNELVLADPVEVRL
ncbi:MAG: DNA/RNA nuclease SfsA [Eubacterium sp.]|nr:DNA/RNA nuclease SfsA [Candidatus Colimonas fimequi]